MPAELLDGENVGRFGFRNYIHPKLGADMFEQELESLLLHLLDAMPSLYTDGAWGWGKGEDLRQELFAGDFGEQARAVFVHSGAFAHYLGKLKDRYPDRVKSKHTNKGNVGLIYAPAS